MKIRLLVPSCLAIALVASTLVAAERSARPKSGEYNPDHASVEMFQAIEDGKIEVKFIPKDSTEANILIKNKTKQPLNVQLPEAFAGVPVLAQIGAGGGFGGGNQGGGQNQGVGGGGGQGFGGGGQGGGNFFNVPPEKVGELKLPTVCLEHGKKEPRAAIPYEIRPIASFNTDPAVHELLKLFGRGGIDQRSAQAAAWHLANKMSWQELRAKQIVRADGSRYQWFSDAELQRGMSLATTAQQLAKDKPKASPGDQVSQASPGK